ncbi:MAG: glycosyltransferase family 4 protein [Bacteroidales bacterium]|jgi:glycosyltransferase involved in cell wall biosynthesis|nr:glycosyltransferase family 4 protein [Bacteroidales bacterium]
MNTLHLSTLGMWDISPGKGRLSTYLPLKGFIQRGHSVCYITNYSCQKSENFDGITIKRIRTLYSKTHPSLHVIFFPLNFICFFIAAIRQIIKTRPHVIYSHTAETALPAFLLSRLFKTRYVMRMYGVFYSPTFKLKASYLFPRLAFSLIADVYILTDDGTNARNVALSFGIPDSKIHFLKNGIDKSWNSNTTDEILKKQIAPNNEQIILTVSRLAKWKQVDLIIKAMPGLLSLNSNVKLIIVGDGPEEHNLKYLCTRLGIPGNIYFTGALPHSDINNYISIADLFISMNALSSISNPVLEAMICGKTVIALNKGATPELIEHNVNGILVEQNEINRLPQIISAALADGAFLQRTGAAARQFILDNFMSWQERTEYEVDLIENIVNNTCGK